MNRRPETESIMSSLTTTTPAHSLDQIWWNAKYACSGQYPPPPQPWTVVVRDLPGARRIFLEIGMRAAMRAMGAVPTEDRIAVWAALADLQAGINEGHAPALPRGIPRIGGGVSFTSPAYSALSAIQRYCRFACLAAPNEPMSPVCMRQVLHLLDSPWCQESQADALAILREMDPRK